jgi:hypothetical protein
MRGILKVYLFFFNIKLMFFNVFCDFDVKNKKYIKKYYFNIFF